MFLLSCCRLVFFSGVLPLFLHICWVFCSRKCVAKILFFLGLVFEIHFRERAFVLVVLCGVLPMFLHICWVFCSRKCLAKILFFLGLVSEIHFRERAIVFVVLSHSSVFGGVLHTFFHIRWFLFPRVLGKNSLLPRLVFETLLGRVSGMSFGQSFGGRGGASLP